MENEYDTFECVPLTEIFFKLVLNFAIYFYVWHIE